MGRTHRIGINPLPWVITPAGFVLDEAVLANAMDELAAVGFDALHADIPSGMSAPAYRALLGEHGFVPAPGYFSGAFHDRDRHAEIAEAARAHAVAMAELGLTESFIAADLLPERIATPAAGFGADAERDRIVAEGLVRAAEAAASEGVRYALHPHVGSTVETEQEIRTVLDASAGSALGFGPDVGHLTWAGADPAALILAYRDRVIAAHLKDVDAGAVAAAREESADYWRSTVEHHVWTEPGRGVVDFDDVFSSLPADFDGWFVIEVDVPNLPTAQESSRAALEFVAGHDHFTEVAA